MRLDQFLVASRIIKRRTLAQEFCDKGLIDINQSAAKSSKEIKTGDEIKIKRSSEHLTVRVLKVPSVRQISKADAADLFEVLRIEKIETPV